MGTSQISNVPYVLSLNFEKISFGTWSFLLNLLFIVMQIVLLKKEFHPIQFLQIPVNVLFSCMIDISMTLLKNFQPELTAEKVISLLAGCFILAFGIATEIAPDVITVPGEGIVRAIAAVTGKKFGTVKVYFDITLIAIAAVLSLALSGELKGVGIGTVVSAITVGRFVNLINKYMPAVYMEKKNV